MLEPVDYLVIGHLALDITPQGLRLGGTAAYSALTAHALGLRVGVVTSWGNEIPLRPLRNIPVACIDSDQSTKFENISTSNGRIQILHSLASSLDYYQIPDPWRQAPIVHLGPIAQELAPSMLHAISSPMVCVTPQGWLRAWDSGGRVYPSEWPEASFVLQRTAAAVMSIEDVASDEERVEEMAAASRVLVVTEAAEGARVYWNGDVRRFRPPEVVEVDSTGAGDIFAAAFFTRLYATRDPWEAARFANQLAAASVTRRGLEGIPTPQEVEASLLEVF